MNLSEVIRKRRMVRRYADRPVPSELVEELLAYARKAPSAGFTQGVSFLVLTERSSVQQFWRATSSGPSRWVDALSTAPVLIGVFTSERAYVRRYTEPDKGWAEADQPWCAPYWYVDAGMAAEHVLLGAVERGLGACFFGAPADRVDALKAEFGVPDEQQFVGVISLGWPADTDQPSGSPRHRPRRPAAEQIHRERW